jgi:ribonucleoside-triphosphate reductase
MDFDPIIIKKSGASEKFNPEKIINAVNKSAERAIYRKFNSEEQARILHSIETGIETANLHEITINVMHGLVENSLNQVCPLACEEYKKYRNWKQLFAQDYAEIYEEIDQLNYRGDKDNANTDSSLVSTRKSMGYAILSKKMYQRFFLTAKEFQMCKDGYIYIHDMSSRRETFNCCLFDIEEVLSGGFEMGNIYYNEPNTLDVAFAVIGDIVLAVASQQYGGFTLPQIDKVLEPYAIKSYNKYCKEYDDIVTDLKADDIFINDKRDKYATDKVRRDFEQGFQGWEMKFNTVASSRGDYPFITITSGLNMNKFGKICNLAMFKVRQEGQGKPGFKKPVLFAKLVFLYDENLHYPGEDIFDAAIDCSMHTMYPDWLSLTGEGYVPEMYKTYGEVVSPMGCRAFLSPWYEEGGMHPKNANDKPVFVGRFNLGVVSLHLPMIYAQSMEEKRDFYEVLDEYLEAVRFIHKRTIEYLGEMKAYSNPVAFCWGGLYGGHLNLNDKIAPVLKSCTASFGITALNELQELYNQKSLVEDGEFAIEVMKHISSKINEFKEEDGILYAIYGTPAESLCGLQIKQFRNKYGVIKNVSDRPYVSNSFHCHVTEKINPIEKQDLENRFWNYFNGGKIQYVRYPVNYNRKAVETLIIRAMKLGYYEGVNMSLAYCDDCGHEELEMDVCPVCGSRNLTKIDRMNGYLAYSRVKGDTRLNDAKMSEISQRVSM